MSYEIFITSIRFWFCAEIHMKHKRFIYPGHNFSARYFVRRRNQRYLSTVNTFFFYFVYNSICLSKTRFSDWFFMVFQFTYRR